MGVEQSSDKEFIAKLTEKIEANLSDEHFSIPQLAAEFGMSRYTLLRKVNDATNLTVNQFVRQVRLKKAREILKDTSLTVSEVAYKVGFSSPVYFSKCFRDHYGYPPGKAGQMEVENSSGDPAQSGKKRTKIFLFSTFFLVALSVALIILVKPFSNEQNTLDKSIIVLFPNDNNSDSEYIHQINGTVDAVLNNLSLIRDLKVYPMSSVLKFRNSDKSGIEIAKELGASYLIESSGIAYGNSIVLDVRLIDVNEGKQMWYYSYSVDIEDIIQLPMEIAREIAGEIHAEITQEEQGRMDKLPTENIDAYNLYLKGRFFWTKRTEDGVKRSIELFTEAVVTDPNYALAWVGLADAYHILSGWGYFTPKKEGETKAKNCAIKALEIDNNLAEAHATLGFLLSYSEWKWDEAEKELIEAIRIKPNYAFAHHVYSLLLDIKGDHQKAFEENRLALEFDPLSPILHYERATFFYNEGNFDKSLKECQEMLSLEPNFPPTQWWIFKNYYRLGYGDKALTELQRILQLDTRTEIYTDKAKEIYSESGLGGLIDWLIEITYEIKSNNAEPDINLYWEGYLPELHAISGHKVDALSLIEYYLETNTEGDRLVRLINNLDYETIRNEERFLNVVKKLGLMEHYKNTIPPYRQIVK